MSLNQWFRKPRRRPGVADLDLKSLDLLANKSATRQLEVNLVHLGNRKIYVENPGQVEYFKAADKAIDSLSR